MGELFHPALIVPRPRPPCLPPPLLWPQFTQFDEKRRLPLPQKRRTCASPRCIHRRLRRPPGHPALPPSPRHIPS
ncbi:hypothetical protein V9T40_004484 [Parthenolecanium corni]|uniref:Uncharacterized protein n=1 Tax=Parthenolecanium corni TaxID=536013 RepID=A0AAN9TU34_9HEMI